MSIRYLVRPQHSEDLAAIRKVIPNLDSQLGKAKEGLLRKAISYQVSSINFIHYQFVPKKKGTDWEWVCPCIELDAENEASLLDLCKKIQVAPPAHLTTLQ